MAYADLPKSVQKALALRATFEHTFGFDADTQIFLVACQIANEPALPPGQVYLTTQLRLGGNPHGQPDFCAVAGPIDVAWWNGDGTDETVAAWNALTNDERNAVRWAFADAPLAERLGAALLSNGITPPTLRDRVLVTGAG